jgi:hypothetical protein
MPLQKLQFAPGVNREGTATSAEGTWFDIDKVRFRSGNAEKIGGWVADTGTQLGGLQPPTGAYWGIARAMWNWVNLSGFNLLGLGTDLKYYIQNTIGGNFNDVTPLKETTAAGDVTFAAVNGSDIITVTDAGSNTQANDFVTFSGAVSLGGNITADILNAEHQVVEVISSGAYKIKVSATADASDTGNGGAAVIGAYQISTGAGVATVGVGWGAGGWSGITQGLINTGWGAASATTVGVGIQLRTWSQSNYGEDLIINPRGSGLFYWQNNASPSIFDRAVLLSQNSPAPFDTDADCPVRVNYTLISDASRFVIAFGCNDYGSIVLDPLLIRWSDQEDYATWTPVITNQAGSFRLSIGSEIIMAQQTRQEILVWTDSAVYSMQYQGPPFVWGFQPLATNTSIASPNAAVTVHDATYWMGVDKFYVYSGRVQTLPCSVRQYVFQNINLSQRFQFFAGINDAYSEVWWFYCAEDSVTIDRYVVYNYLENTWYYGNLSRTAWIDNALRQVPIAAGYGGRILYHETGNDDGTTNPPTPITAFVQSADVDIGDGHDFVFVWRIIPDVTFDGSTSPSPSLNFSMRPRQFPGTNYGPANNPNVSSANNYALQRTYNVQQFTPQVNVRIRGRQMAFRVESSDLGVAWQLGVPRIDLKPDGRR